MYPTKKKEEKWIAIPDAAQFKCEIIVIEMIIDYNRLYLPIYITYTFKMGSVNLYSVNTHHRASSSAAQ